MEVMADDRGIVRPSMVLLLRVLDLPVEQESRVEVMLTASDRPMSWSEVFLMRSTFLQN